MKTILITGGTGFIGYNLCARLIREGNRVICVDNNYTGSLDNVAAIADNPNFQFILHDIVNPLEIDEHIDEIYNLACPASPPAYQGKHSITTTRTCVIGALNMLELTQRRSAELIKYAVSATGAAKGADILAMWSDFKKVPLDKLEMRRKNIIDMRHIIDADAAAAAGFECTGVGK
jgi:nucleoside-diphosphate-sugar epimerase